MLRQKGKCVLLAQVNYLESRISRFAADFEKATGCAATHPVYAACQVSHLHAHGAAAIGFVKFM